VAEHFSNVVRGPLEDDLADAPLDNQESKEDLEAETPDDGAPTYRMASRGERVSDAKKNSKSNQSSESAQLERSC
jgi:hypothetical protein